jgi:hypothetical protein
MARRAPVLAGWARPGRRGDRRKYAREGTTRAGMVYTEIGAASGGFLPGDGDAEGVSIAGRAGAASGLLARQALTLRLTAYAPRITYGLLAQRCALIHSLAHSLNSNRRSRHHGLALPNV